MKLLGQIVEVDNYYEMSTKESTEIANDFRSKKQITLDGLPGKYVVKEYYILESSKDDERKFIVNVRYANLQE